MKQSKSGIFKLIASLAAFIITFSNFGLLNNGIMEVIAEDGIAKEKAKQTELQAIITKYVQYQNEANKGVLLQTKLLISTQEEQDNYMPVLNNEITIEVPKIEGQLPEVQVIAKSTENTNGLIGKDVIFDESNWNYNKDTGLLIINYNNSNGYEEYTKDTRDEFDIIYKYPEASYTGYDKTIALPVNIELKRTLDAEKIDIVKKIDLKVDLEKQIGDIVTFEIQELNELYKGYMYTSKESGINKDTEYQTKDFIEISNADLIDKIEIEKNTNYKNTEEEIEAEEIEYKESKIKVSEFEKILGNDGLIEILSNNNKIASIAYEEIQEEGKTNKKLIKEDYRGEKEEVTSDEIVITYPEGITHININTSKAKTEGTIEVVNTKIIKGDTTKTLEELEGIKSISENVRIIGIKNKIIQIDENQQEETQIQVSNYSNNKEIELKEPITDIEWEISKKTWSTLEKNNITITAKLKDNESKYRLFNNPQLKIELPENIIEKLNGNISILHQNGLKLINSSINKGIIQINLDGKQLEYSNSPVGGVYITINLDLKLNELTPTQDIELKLSCTENDKITSMKSEQIKVQSKQSLLMINTIKYKDTEIKTYNSELKTEEITINDSFNITQNITLLNDHEEDLKNVEITEKILETEKENFFLQINQIQGIENVKLKLSEDGLNWLEKEEVSDYNKIKYYKLLIGEIKSKEVLSLNINSIIPENVKAEECYINTVVEYEIQNIKLKEESNVKINVKNGENQKEQGSISNTDIQENTAIQEKLNKLDINAEIYINEELQEENVVLTEGQYFDYRVTLKNNNEEKIENLKVRAIIENLSFYELRDDKLEGTRYYESEEGDNERGDVISLDPGQEVSFEYQVVVRENSNSIKNVIILEIENQTKQIEKINKVEEGKIKLNLEYEFNEERLVYSGHRLNVLINLSNLTSQDLENIEIYLDLPEELDLDVDEQEEKDNIRKEGSRINIAVQKLLNKQTKHIKLECLTKDIPIDITEKEVDIIVKSNIDNKEYQSNILRKTILQSKAGLVANLTESNDKMTVEDGDEFIYTIELENTGTLNLSSVSLSQYMDRGLKIQNAKIERENGIIEEIEIYSDRNITHEFKIKSKEKIIITIKVKASQNDMLNDATEITNNIKISNGQEIPLNYSKTYQIFREEIDEDFFEDLDNPNQPDDPINPDDPTNPDDDAEQKEITGIAWLDENKDGKRDSTEKRISNISVIIYNKDTKEIKRTSTDEEGKYSVTVDKGTYIIIFEYDTNNYRLAEYQKSGVESNINSDVINGNVIIDKIVAKKAITDEIRVTDSNINNIDIGLVKKEIFDLDLEKTITSVVVKNQKETKTIEYNKTKLAKVDLVAKYINNTDVIIEYTFTIKNNGELAGYIGKIEDNLPTGLMFSSELNPQWYKGSNGKLYSSQLSNTIINPGETKEIKLILTKGMNENNTGTFKNTANILDTNNLSGIEEKDLENNASFAEIILSIKTGGPELYITITIISILIIATGAYVINKKFLLEE